MKKNITLIIAFVVSILLLICLIIFNLLPEEKKEEKLDILDTDSIKEMNIQESVLDEDFLIEDLFDNSEEVDEDVQEALKLLYFYDNYYLNINVNDRLNDGMFTDSKVTLNNLSLESKYAVIVGMMEEDGYFDNAEYFKYTEAGNEESLVALSEEEAKKYDNEYGDLTCDADMIVRKYYGITGDLINKYAEDIFGIKNIRKVSFNFGCIECKYKNGEYDCRNYTGGYATRPFRWEAKVVDYDKTDTEILLYHKAFYVGFNNEGSYVLMTDRDGLDVDNKGNIKVNSKKLITSLGNEFLTIDTNDLLEEYGITFKSVFKKNNNGEYRWVSTEPVKN